MSPKSFALRLQLPIAFSNHFRSTVFNVIRMKSKNKFVKKRRAAHQIMLLSKFANGTFSWISPGCLTEAEIGAETQTKVLNIFCTGGKSGEQLEQRLLAGKIGQTGKMLSCLFYEWVLGLLFVCDFVSTKGVVDLRWRLPMWWLNWFKILSFSQVLLVLRLLHPVAVVVIFSPACHLQYRQQWPKSKSCWVLSSEKKEKIWLLLLF